jgi:hypothetical protein
MMEGQEEEVRDHVDDIEVVGVEEAPAAAAAETPAGSQLPNQSARAPGYWKHQWFSS